MSPDLSPSMKRRGATQPKHPPRHRPRVCRPTPFLTSRTSPPPTGVHRPLDQDSVRHHAPPLPPGLRIAPPWISTFGWEEERRHGAAGEAASGSASTFGGSLGRWIGGGVTAVPRSGGLEARRDPVSCGPRGRAVDVWAMRVAGRRRSGCGGME
jgi:hypothetical protein